MRQIVFEICSYCGKHWTSREKFLSDATVRIKGYQADFESLETGIFLFIHQTADCGTTLGIEVYRFADLFNGTRYPERQTGAAECHGYCLRVENFQKCNAQCDCAWVRQLITVIHDWPKSAVAS